MLVIDAGEARAHLLALRQQGIGRRQVSALTGVAASTVSSVIKGHRTKLLASTAKRLLACPCQPASGPFTSSGWSRRYIQALRSEGYTDAQIEKWVGVDPERVFHAEHIRTKVARATERVYRLATGEAAHPLLWRSHSRQSEIEVVHG